VSSATDAEADFAARAHLGLWCDRHM